MKVQYLEIVTNEVDAQCELYTQTAGAEFGEPDPALGGAKTASLADGAMVGIRAPMHEAEKPITRGYFLVEDIEAAVAAADKAGALVALPPMPLPGHGTCAIYIKDGIETGLWQV